MTDDAAIRDHISRLLAWSEAHVSYDDAVKDLPAELRGRQPAGLPYSPWQIVEHVRITQDDILDFCRNAHYEEKEWPKEYWPSSPTPGSDVEWETSLTQFRRDREALQAMAVDPAIDLTAKIPHGSGQTYLRELLLVADHTAYHVGELVVARRLLGAWKK
jgi:uncharacterized damage-inducible protein DinB